MLLNPPLQKSFNNISQRMLSGLMIAFSDFESVNSDVPETSQKNFYDIMKNILLSIYNNPEKIGLPVSKDDCFRAFMCGNQNPELNKLNNEIMIRINDFYKILYFAGNIGEIEGDQLLVSIKSIKNAKIKIRNEYITFLTSIGLLTSMTKEDIIFNIDKDILKAWQLLAKVTLHTDIYDKTRGVNSVHFGLLKFVCALYIDDFSYYQNNVEALHNLPKGYFTPYIENLKQHGFYEDTFGSLSEVEFKIRGKVSGFAIRFSPGRDEQFYFMAENCQGVKAMLADFDNLPAKIKNYLVLSCGKCTGCLGCTKGGKSKAFTMDVFHNEQQISLCPQFNRREWFSVNDQFMEALTEYILLQEKYGKSK